MNNWKEQGDGEYTRIVDDGAVAKVFETQLFWRAAIDDRMVDDIFFDARDAINAIDAWEAGARNITLHDVDRRWNGDERHGYTRRSQSGELQVTQSTCGNWKINHVQQRCFGNAEKAQRYADERLP